MTTRDFAMSLVGIADADEIERRLLVFLGDFLAGYGVNYRDGERGQARAYAEQNGYFWLPCILCGNWGGGQEASGGCVMLTPGTSYGVCGRPECRQEAQRLNAKFPQGVSDGALADMPAVIEARD